MLRLGGVLAGQGNRTPLKFPSPMLPDALVEEQVWLGGCVVTAMLYAAPGLRSAGWKVKLSVPVPPPVTVCVSPLLWLTSMTWLPLGNPVTVPPTEYGGGISPQLGSAEAGIMNKGGACGAGGEFPRNSVKIDRNRLAKRPSISPAGFGLPPPGEVTRRLLLKSGRLLRRYLSAV